MASGGTEGSVPTNIPLGSVGGSGGAPTRSGSEGTATTDAGGTPPVVVDPVPTALAPCPTDGTACKIMPLGDSITDGVGSNPGAAPNDFGSNGGYRVELFRQAVSDGHNITFVGTRPPNGPMTVAGQPFPRNHEGLSGDSIQGTGNRARTAIPATAPNIILLHIGTNNLNAGLPQGVPGQLATLVDQITEQAPDALLVVAQLVPTEDAGRTQSTQAYNATIPALVQDRAAKGKHVVMVDMFTPFSSNPGGANALFHDVLHPNVAGYVVMAQTWYDAIESVLP
jgi:GDSL-like lipase/acylhydrolase family protein